MLTTVGSLILLLVGSPGPEGSSEKALFDGRTLDGWQRFVGRAAQAEPDRAFGVEDGLLVSYGEGGGWLGTDRDYDDFVLNLEFRTTPGSNSGIYLRAPAEASHISRTGLEVQILDEDAPKHRNIQPWQKTGAIYHVAAPEPGHLRPPGEWNRMMIQARGPRITIALNGATVVDDRLDSHPELAEEHPGLARRSGRIGIQSHNGRVEFRNLVVRPLGERISRGRAVKP